LTKFWLKQLKEDEEHGFTLIELMVVVLIIAILIAIAIPTFLGARKRAQDRAAQSSIRNSLTAAKTIFTDHEDYLEATDSALGGSEPTLCFLDDDAGLTPVTGGPFPADCTMDQATGSNDPKEVVIEQESATIWRAGAFSKSGKCFYIRDVSGPVATTSGLGTKFSSSTADGNNGDCSVAEMKAAGITNNSW